MKKWLRRIRGAFGMGLTWAVGWALAGLLVGVTSKLLPWVPLDWFFEVFDAPLPAFAIPGFFAGVFFSTVLGIAGRRRRFGELSLSRFAAWGVVGGLLLTLFPFALDAVGLASLNPGAASWPVIAALGGTFVVLSTISAAVTLMAARGAERRELRANEEVAELGITDGEARRQP